jgi:hypothetical protein
MSDHAEEKIDRLIDQVEKMNRGLYGDPENKQKGLMQVVYDNVDEVKQLKEKDQRRTWMIAGFSSAASLTLPVLWEWAKKIFGS